MDSKVSAFYYRTGVSIRIAESDAFKKMVTGLNPAYGPLLKSAKTIAGSQLDSYYTSLKAVLINKIKDANSFVIISDGWTNVRSKHIINFIYNFAKRASAVL